MSNHDGKFQYIHAMESKLIEGETYRVDAETLPAPLASAFDKCTLGWAVFRPRRTYDIPEQEDPIECDSISNMNSHWSKDRFDREDGENTYPWLKGNSISVWKREARPATELEKAILDWAIEKGHAPTEAEIREIKMEIIGL